jgi:hypothetical protein
MNLPKGQTMRLKVQLVGSPSIFLLLDDKRGNACESPLEKSTIENPRDSDAQ